MDEDAFPFGEARHLEEIGPDGEEGFRQSRGFDGVVTLREGQGLPGRHGAILRIAAAIGERADFVAQLEFGNAFTQSNHLAGDFKAEDRACILRRRIGALPLCHIRPVDARRLDLHQNLAFCGLRQRRLRKPHHLRAAMGREVDEAHCFGQGLGVGHGQGQLLTCRRRLKM